MMTVPRSFTPTLLIIAAAVIMLPAFVNAQQHSDEPSEAIQDIQRLLGTSAIEYWTPRLNDYKTRIDHILTTSDLDALNRLRVRWSVLISESLREQRQAEAEDDSLKLDVNGMDRMGEVMDLVALAREIAGRYRSELDNVGVTVVGDLGGFVQKMCDITDEYIAAHPLADSHDSADGILTARRNDLVRVGTTLQSSEGRASMAAVYDFAIEPVILLYNGLDLATLLAGGMPQGIAGVGGLSLPESGTLLQNFPNPARSSTTIPYMLTANSLATVIHLYDASGTLVGRWDQGALDAGKHSLAIDVSSLASGAYLYHLTVTTDAGERVFSRVMNVVQ